MKLKFYSFLIRFSIGESFTQEVQEIASDSEQAREKAMLTIYKAYGTELSADTKILSVERGKFVNAATI